MAALTSGNPRRVHSESRFDGGTSTQNQRPDMSCLYLAHVSAHLGMFGMQSCDEGGRRAHFEIQL
jgi:hypothetical protein